MTANKNDYTNQVDSKVGEILPLLSGLSYNAIEDILNKVKEVIKTMPVTVSILQA